MWNKLKVMMMIQNWEERRFGNSVIYRWFYRIFAIALLLFIFVLIVSCIIPYEEKTYQYTCSLEVLNSTDYYQYQYTENTITSYSYYNVTNNNHKEVYFDYTSYDNEFTVWLEENNYSDYNSVEDFIEYQISENVNDGFICVKQ